MELGIFSRTYEAGGLGEVFRRMADHGIRHTQFNFSSAGLPSLPETIAPEQLETIRTLADRFQITLDALSGTFNMIDPDEDARERGCRQFQTQCAAARQLGIPIVSLCTGSKNPKSKWVWHDDNSSPAAWDELLRSTERVLRAAEDNNVILGVETEASNIINTPARARQYLDTMGSPRLKIIMDGANLFRPEQVPYQAQVLDEAFDALGGDIVLAHAKDFTFAQSLSFVAAGAGSLDFPRYIALLKRAGYRGVLEMHGLSEEQIPASRSFLEALL